jgi:hypothetical protein
MVEAIVPPKIRLLEESHGVTYRKKAFFVEDLISKSFEK